MPAMQSYARSSSYSTPWPQSGRGSSSSTSYTSFDYGKAYGSNPFTQPTTRIWNLAQQTLGDLGAAGSTAGSGSTSATAVRSWATPRDPEVRDYLSNLMGGQRNTLDEYVRRAAGAGIKRGGLNVVGGPALDSALHHTAMKTLAAGYADRFSRAMDYGKYARSAQYGQYQEGLRNAQSLLGLHHQYLSSQANWQNRVADQMAAAWKGDVDWNRQQPERELALEGLARQMDMERRRNVWEQEDRRRARDQEFDAENRWRQLLQKAALMSRAGTYGAGWTDEDVVALDRLGVQMGYLKPWQRTLSLKTGSQRLGGASKSSSTDES